MGWGGRRAPPATDPVAAPDAADGRPGSGVRRVGPLEAADIGLALRLARAKDRPSMRAAGSASEVGSWQALLALSAGTLAAGLILHKPRLAAAGRHMLLSGMLASATKTTAKRLVHRTRPNVLMDEGLYTRGRLGPNVGPWQSFPSGHAAMSAAVACAVGRAYPDLKGKAAAAAAGIALVQVLRGAHCPADVPAGALIGIAAVAGVDRIAGPVVPVTPAAPREA